MILRMIQLFFWTNGGPGCSGLLGLAAEHGPYILSHDGTLTPNPYSWNKAANMLYVEQPAGVGFSFFDDTDEESFYTSGDDMAAKDNWKLIKEFVKRFPERKANDFFISSESYGGHYMPQLAKHILRHNTDNTINFRGFIVGNPYVDPYSNYVTQMTAYYGHGLIAKPLFDAWYESCAFIEQYDPKICHGLERSMYQEMGPGINPYALDYPICTKEIYDDSHKTPATTTPSSQVMALLQHSQFGLGSSHESSNTDRFLAGPPFLPSQDKYNPCAEVHTLNYLNRQDVRDALHVQVDKEWTVCTRDINYSRQDSNTPQVDLYIDLLQYAKDNANTTLNMMIFSGDDDSICSTAGTQAWIYDLGVDHLPGSLWKAWTLNDQTAGYVTKFDLGEGVKSSFTFVTVHGAGHEVPSYRPAEALELFKRYLSNEW
uniref:Carboxypeptidase n=1 Tax=Ditylum brightwellii TaxID=49249 RepID=A0A7S4VBU0_9STRA